ncbi:TPA: MT-A70 family methyltransferase [Serratia fonticola]
MTYQLIYADPPWTYGNKVSNGAAGNHYITMTLQDLKRLPVWSIAAPDAVLAMWYTGTHTEQAKELAEAWGFDVRQMFLFTWVKLNEMAERTVNAALEDGGLVDFYDFLDLLNGVTRMNPGNYSRGNQESMLVAVRGAGLERADAAVKQIIYAPISQHSTKPWEARQRLERLYGDVSRIELFSRCDAPGWDHWGDECPQSDINLAQESFKPQNQPQNIPEIILPETANKVWPQEVNFLLQKVESASQLPDHLQQKLCQHINRLKLEGMPESAIVHTITSLSHAMGTTT